MLITRTPFRISFAGGGSDLPSFYNEEPGHVLSASIDKYMYIAIHPYFEEGKTFIKYSKTEIVNDIKNIEHPIVKQILNDYGVTGVDITSIADILSGTGLGSSSSYTVGLIHAINAYLGKYISKDKLALEACKIEIEKLGEPIGKQDQYAAAFGGLNYITFFPDGNVNVEPVAIKRKTINELNENLLMFYVGNIRSASEILKKQSENIKDRNKRDSLRAMTQLAKMLRDSLYKSDLSNFASILHEGWMLKKELASGITNKKIDRYYDIALQNGAKGGKLLGAGGGGFLLFYCEKENQENLIESLEGLRNYHFSFDDFGTKVVYYN